MKKVAAVTLGGQNQELSIEDINPTRQHPLPYAHTEKRGKKNVSGRSKFQTKTKQTRTPSFMIGGPPFTPFFLSLI